jgi:hypothetical protein
LRSGLALAFAVVGLVACGGGDGDGDGYPQESIDAFVQECRAQPSTSEGQCRCVVERLQESMPYEEFERADIALKENREPAEASIEKLRTAVTACATS